MKKKVVILLFIFGMLMQGALLAQPDPRGAPTGGNTPLGGGGGLGAPIDGGLFILLSMAGAYGVRVVRTRKRDTNQ